MLVMQLKFLPWLEYIILINTSLAIPISRHARFLNVIVE